MTDYCNRINDYWIELDHYQDVKMLSSDDATTLTTMLELDRIVEFLAGLNPDMIKLGFKFLRK